MSGSSEAPLLSVRHRTAVAFAFAAGLAIALAGDVAAQRRGPDSVADVAEKVLDAVVNISTSQTVSGQQSVPMPQLPPGSPFEDFFEELFKRRGEQNGNRPRRVSSL